MRRAVQEYFDRDADNYRLAYAGPEGSTRSRIFRERRRLVLECLEDPVGRILNVGSGPGVFEPLLLERGGELWMVDVSPEMVSAGRRLLAAHPEAHRVHCQVADVEALPFPEGTFDTTLCVGVLQYLAAPGVAIAELSRVTRPGGQVVISFPNAGSWLNWGHQGLVRMLRAGRRALRRAGIELRPHPLRLSFRDDIPDAPLEVSRVEEAARQAGLEPTRVVYGCLQCPVVLEGFPALLRGWDRGVSRLVTARRLPRWGREAILCFRRIPLP